MKITRKQLKQIIQEELNEQYGGSELTPEQEKVQDLCHQLADLIYEMGPSNPEMADAYIDLFRALVQAGVNVKAVAMMA